MNDSGSSVPIAHFGWDLTLIGDEQCSRERRVVDECAVDCLPSAELDARQEISGWLRPTTKGFWRRRSGDRYDRGCEDDYGVARPI